MKLSTMYGPQDPDEDQERFPKLKEFCSSTSAHGYGHLTKGSKGSKACWAVVVVTALIASGFHLYSLTSTYLQYDYYEVVSVKPEVERIFPDVTICDTAAMSEHALMRSESGRRFMLYHQSLVKEFQNLSKYLKKYPLDIYSHFIAHLSHPKFVIPNIPTNQTASIGVQFDSLVVGCKFKELTCNESNFQHFLSKDYLNCYTFKANTMKSNFKNLFNSDAGLSLILRREPATDKVYKVQSKTGNVDGIHIDIHPSNTVPFMQSYGLDLMPGISTSIELNQKNFERLQAPYSHCKPAKWLTMLSREYLMEPVQCIMDCFQDIIFDTCKCVSVNFRHAADNEKDYCMNVKIINNTEYDISRAICEIKTIINVARNTSSNCSKCSWNCEETKYDTKITQVKWPQESTVNHFVTKLILAKPVANPVREYYEYLIRELNFSAPVEGDRLQNGISTLLKTNSITGLGVQNLSLMNINEAMLHEAMLNDADLSNSFRLKIPNSLMKTKSLSDLQCKWIDGYFYRVNIYFSDLYVTVHKQVPSFSFGDFWSGVGGVLGIWAGASVLTILEVFSFLGSLLSRNIKIGQEPNNMV